MLYPLFCVLPSDFFHDLKREAAVKVKLCHSHLLSFDGGIELHPEVSLRLFSREVFFPLAFICVFLENLFPCTVSKPASSLVTERAWHYLK